MPSWPQNWILEPIAAQTKNWSKLTSILIAWNSLTAAKHPCSAKYLLILALIEVEVPVSGLTYPQPPTSRLRFQTRSAVGPSLGPSPARSVVGSGLGSNATSHPKLSNMAAENRIELTCAFIHLIFICSLSDIIRIYLHVYIYKYIIYLIIYLFDVGECECVKSEVDRYPTILLPSYVHL